MNNLSTTNSPDISSLIGAFELGDHLEIYGDGILEAVGTTMAGPPTMKGGGYGCTAMIRCPSDGALEAAADLALGPFPAPNTNTPTVTY